MVIFRLVFTGWYVVDPMPPEPPVSGTAPEMSDTELSHFGGLFVERCMADAPHGVGVGSLVVVQVYAGAVEHDETRRIGEDVACAGDDGHVRPVDAAASRYGSPDDRLSCPRHFERASGEYGSKIGHLVGGVAVNHRFESGDGFGHLNEFVHRRYAVARRAGIVVLRGGIERRRIRLVLEAAAPESVPVRRVVARPVVGAAVIPGSAFISRL